MKKVQKGKALEELVKGSINYTMEMIRKAFRDQFRDWSEGQGYIYIEEIFGDHVIVKPDRGLKIDEYYLVTYQRNGDAVVFAPVEQWQVVELAYQPQSAMSESRKAATQGRKRMVEEMGHLALAESVEEGAPRRVKAVGITANVINGNDRLYPAEVLEAAVQELQPKLVESAGSGRVLQVLGEAEHPSSKGGRPNILETVFKWEAVSFDGSQVLLEGIILPTSKGKDILTLLENGVQVPISQRAYGASKTEKIEGRKVEKVTELHITGYDATLEPSDPVAVILESQEGDEEKEKMDPEELKKYLTDHPELFEGMVTSQVEKLSAAQLAKLEEQMRAKLGIEAGVDLGKALEEAAQAKRELEEQKRQRAIDAAIAEQSKGLPYGDKLNGMFVESLKKAGLQSAEAVKQFAESKRAEYDQLAAAGVLSGMGFIHTAERVQVSGPVLEKETGTPEFARAAWELSESIRKAERRLPRDLRQPKTINEEMTALYLAKFDKTFHRQLLQEAKLLEEAEQASDLSLPYSVSRAVIAEAFPELIAISVFDFAMSDQADTAKLFYEAHAGETGYLVTVTDEVVTSDESAWKALGYKRITPGSVVLTGSGGTPTYTEGTDYVIDYANGQLWTLPSPGTIGDGTSLKIDYTYTAIRKGELAAIEKAKLTLSTKTLTLAADRLATDISNEAVVFARGALGYDATGRTLASLVRQMRRKIDQGILYKALASELIVASNSGGTWTASTDPVSELVEKIGVAKVKLINRFYVPTSILISATNAEKLSNWDGFTQAGSRPDAMVSAYGFIGSLKGLPVFQSPEMSDSYVSVQNRELVMHRVGRPLQLFGPYPSYEVSTGKLIASNQYYCEEFNGSDSPVPEKGSYVKIA
jgi:hypothetical protein